MNFLSSALNLISANSIPYTIKEKLVDPQSSSYPAKDNVWTIYNGVIPKTDSPVSIFEFSLNQPNTARYEPMARNAYRKLKSVKFPGILNTVDFIENDSFLYIITERVTPLITYLTENGSKVSSEAKVYGIYNVAKSLEFIGSKASCFHGKLDLASSVYVNSEGEWKLFGFELLTSFKSDPDQPFYRNSHLVSSFEENMPTEVKLKGVDAVRADPTSYDAYRLGVFIVALFESTDYSRPFVMNSRPMASKLSGKAHISTGLATLIIKLVSPRDTRLGIPEFLKNNATAFASNTLIGFSKALEDIKYEDQATRSSFFKHDLQNYIDGEFPPGYLGNKLLPEIINQYNIVTKEKPSVNTTPEEHAARQETRSVLLNHILKLSGNLDESEFTKRVKPIIFNAFTLLDRSVRLCLLKYLPQYTQHLTESDVQNKVFNNLLTGLQDTNFMIREVTLNSIMLIIDKVSVKQINQELLKVLAKLQMDPKPSIRTNTLILIIKISEKIHYTSRNNVVITALAKSLRDTFAPCKMAALNGFESLIDSFTLEEICSKILGHLAISLMDPKSMKVRQESKRIFTLYLDTVEKHAATLPQIEEDEDAEEKEFYEKFSKPSSNEVNAVTSSKSSSSFGWMSKLISTDTGAVQGQLNNSFDRSTPDLTRVSTPKLPQETHEQWIEDYDEDDGWGSESEVVNTQTFVQAKPTLRSTLGTTNTAHKSNVSKGSGLKLGQKQVPGSTLKLDLSLEDDEDNWGEEW